MSNHSVKLQPFKTPNFVHAVAILGKRNEDMKESICFALHELSDETLSQLCSDFKAEVFRKAREPLTVKTTKDMVNQWRN
jgi:hypothetical protein